MLLGLKRFIYHRNSSGLTKWLAFLLTFFVMTIHADSPHNAPTCNCFTPMALPYNRFIKFVMTDDGLPKDKNDPFYDITVKSLIQDKKMIKGARYYSEHRHNLPICNQSLMLWMEYSILETLLYPKTYKKTREELKTEALEAIEKNYATDAKLRETYRNLYRKCTYAGHQNHLADYDRGFLEYIEGNVEAAAIYGEKYLSARIRNNMEAHILPSELVTLGEINIEHGEYAKAIDLLSKAIEKDPANKTAYFHRSAANFELGNFEKALSDYLKSDRLAHLEASKSPIDNSFTEALLYHMGRGTTEAALEFFPTLGNTAYGVGEVLWFTAQHPVESVNQFSAACYELGDGFVKYCKKVDWEQIEGHVEQVKMLYERYKELTPAEKGALIGYSIGKYGVDIFAGGAAVKGVSAIRNLKNANRVCNFEAMAISSANNEAVVANALNHTSQRTDFFKNVKVHVDRQNKHVLGQHNFQTWKSILTHQEPQKLLEKFAGKGEKVRGKIGESGYQEIIDFGEHIGYNLDQNGVQSLTTWGKVHYSIDGAHIVPTLPRKP